MSSLLRSSGLAADDQTGNGNRLAWTLSNGNSLVVVRDNNYAGYGGDGTSVEKIYIYESSDRVTFTLRATVSMPAATCSITAVVYPNNDVSIFHEDNLQTTIRHTRYTYSTWAVAQAWQTVATAGANEVFRQFDAHTTDDSWVVLAAVWANYNTGAHGFRSYLKPTNAGAWSTPANVQTVATGYSEDCSAISVTSSITNLVSGNTHRQIHYAVGYSAPATGGLYNKDQGVHVFNQWINSATFAPSAAPVDIGTSFAKMLDNDQNSFTVPQMREVKFFKWDSKIWLGICQAGINTPSLWAMRFTTATTGLVLEGAPSSNDAYAGDKTSLWISPQPLTLGVAFANGAFNFMFGLNSILFNKVGRLSGSDFTWSPTNQLWVNGAGGAYDPGTNFFPNYNPADAYVWVSSGGDKNNDLHRVDTVYLSRNTTPRWAWRFQTNEMESTLGGSGQAPASGSTVQTSNPIFKHSYRHPGFWAQSRGALQVQAAKDVGITSSVKDFVGQHMPYGQNGNNHGIPTYYQQSATTPDILYLQSGSTPWYYRVRAVDEWGNWSSWSTVISFTVTHPSTAVPLKPKVNDYIDFGTGALYTEWRLSDVWAPDWQTAFQVQVIRTDTSAIVHDSGKLTSANQFYTTPALSATLKGIPMAWRVQVWDSGDQTYGYSAYTAFTILDGPTITLTSPASGATVVTPNPTFTFGVTTYSAVNIVSLAVSVYQNGIQIWSTGVITPPGGVVASGSTYNIQMLGNLLHNGQNYSVQISATDAWGITTTTSPSGFSAVWVPPAAPTGVASDVTHYNVEGDGYNRLTWTSATRDAQYSYYAVERQDSMYDPDTATVLETGEWTEVYRTYDKTLTNYEFQDYYAPSGYQVSYRVIQVVTRFNDQVPSDPSAVQQTYPYSESYWLIDPTLGIDDRAAMRLYNVTGDSFTDAYEEAEYAVIGRGFHADQGERLGYTGTLTAQLRSGGGTTARYKRKRLEDIKANSTDLWLRNPFGDVWKVAVKSMQIDRIPGVGRSEFVDVSIPYSQVGK